MKANVNSNERSIAKCGSMAMSQQKNINGFI